LPRRPADDEIMLSGIWVVVVFACYGAALGQELLGLTRRSAGRRFALAATTLVGIAAQAVDLVRHATLVEALPLSSPAEWLFVAAGVLALLYLAAIFYLPSTPSGIVMLPLVLGLVVASQFATHEPFATERTFYYWGTAHGVALMLGTVAVCVGFWAGLMYLIQSYALKRRQSLVGLRLPSLEWLERINSRSLAVSTLLVALGFASGLVLSMLMHRDDTPRALWTDPVVLSSAAMLLWLVVAEVFRLVYPAARQGRKVAYLTLASFLFLVITVLALTFVDSGHAL
jgi:ABC-type transport system involved in cytochrome c biogenesis permease subunit